jgi:hypothetical protein
MGRVGGKGEKVRPAIERAVPTTLTWSQRLFIRVDCDLLIMIGVKCSLQLRSLRKG